MVDTTWIPRAEQVARLTLEVAGLRESLSARQAQVRGLEREVARQRRYADQVRRSAAELEAEVEALRASAPVPDPVLPPDPEPDLPPDPEPETVTTDRSAPGLSRWRRPRRTGP